MTPTEHVARLVEGSLRDATFRLQLLTVEVKRGWKTPEAAQPLIAGERESEKLLVKWLTDNGFKAQAMTTFTWVGKEYEVAG